MYSADYVAKQLEEMKKSGTDLMTIAWKVALMCVGWAYVFGALGELCTPGNRRAYYKSKGAEHPTIASKCQVIRADDPKGSCNGCKWYPKEQRTRIYDCRGFTRWILKVVYGFTLSGGGATSQWNSKTNWAAKGPISTIPKDKLVCVFQASGAKMKHTALAYMGETVEDSSGVQHKKLDSRFTHWALPKCVSPDYVPPKDEPKKEEDKKKVKPVLKKGASGTNVKDLQKQLIALGYSCGAKGADGKFGDDTLKAVKQFQKDRGLKVDGIVGNDTWAALEKATPADRLYTVTVKGQKKAVADEIVAKYGGTIAAQ